MRSVIPGEITPVKATQSVGSGAWKAIDMDLSTNAVVNFERLGESSGWLKIDYNISSFIHNVSIQITDYCEVNNYHFI